MIQYFSLYANVAQSVEQLIRNQQVAGSIPAISSTKKSDALASDFCIIHLPKSTGVMIYEDGLNYVRYYTKGGHMAYCMI